MARKTGPFARLRAALKGDSTQTESAGVTADGVTYNGLAGAGGPAGAPGPLPDGEYLKFAEMVGQRGSLFSFTDLLVLAGPGYEEEEHPTYDHVVFGRHGTHAFFLDEQLIGILIELSADGQPGTYARPDALVEGLRPGAGRDEVRALFGTPVISRDDMDMFDLPGDKRIRFDFEDGAWVMLNITAAGD